MPASSRAGGDRAIASNRAAYHDYFVLETAEAGLALLGTEIKALRQGHTSLREGFVRIDGDQAWLVNVHIAPFESAAASTQDARRPRRLLLHRAEILSLGGKVKQRGLTLLPVRLYWRGNRAKLEIGLCKGKRQYDKRAALAAAEARREMQRALRSRGR